VIAKDRAFLAGGGGDQRIGQPVPIKDIVAEHKRGIMSFNEVRANRIGLRETFGTRLRRVRERYAPLRPRPQQAFKRWKILGRGDDQNLTRPRQHQRRERIIDHRLVVDRQQLLRCRQRHGMEPGAGTPGQNYAAHIVSLRMTQQPVHAYGQG
jgi:hypothetical protein